MSLVNLKAWLFSNRNADGSDDFGLVAQIFAQYFGRFWVKYIIIFACITISSGMTAFIAWFMKDVVNTLFIETDVTKFSSFIIAIIIVFIVRGSATYCQTVLSSRIANAMVADLQKRLYQHMLKQRVSFFEKYHTDSLLMMFNQAVNGISGIMNTLVTRGASDLATLIGLVCLMIWTDWQLTVIVLLVFPIVFLGVSRILRMIRDLIGQEMAGLEVLNRFVRETVQGIAVVKSYNLENKMGTGARGVVEGLESRKNQMAALQAMPVPLLDALGGLAVAGVILFAGYRISIGATDLGTVVSYLTALLLSADPARRLSQLRVGLRQSLMLTSRVYRTLAEDQPDAGGTTPFDVAVGNEPDKPPAITFEGVDFRYKVKGAPILEDVNFEIATGEMAALVGPSGAGKSTVMGLVLKFQIPQKGRVMIGPSNLREIETSDLRRHISYVGQTNFVFHGTMFENLALDTPGVTQDDAYDACVRVGLGEFVDSLPEQLDSVIGEGGAGISGGQAQRLNIARAILRDAPILLLDEVTSALDAENETLVKDYIFSQRGRKTILTIAHRLSTIRQADKIILLDKGRVLDIGTDAELRKSNEYYSKIIELQYV
ncbi:MAG: ABC transporter ATP-binding protein [Pseudomonadota bacterium]